MRAYYCDQFVLPLPEGHRFPMQKYALLRERLVTDGVLRPDDLCVPHAATDQELLHAHDADYIRKVACGTLTEKEIRRMGFPWTPQLVARSRRSVGATIDTSRVALSEGVAVNLSGGTHHAFRGYGSGFCVFNDVAVAARTMQAEGRAQRVIMIDCDVHQGDGTAAICAGDESIFTFSIHGTRNFPFYKQHSDLDIELADGTQDAEYLERLRDELIEALDRAGADLAIYLAGADPFWGDRLGHLKLTKAGLAARDKLVFDFCAAWGLPVAVVMAGGYATNIDDIVDIHCQTIRIAAGM